MSIHRASSFIFLTEISLHSLKFHKTSVSVQQQIPCFRLYYNHYVRSAAHFNQCCFIIESILNILAVNRAFHTWWTGGWSCHYLLLLCVLQIKFTRWLYFELNQVGEDFVYQRIIWIHFISSAMYITCMCLYFMKCYCFVVLSRFTLFAICIQ